MIEVCRRQRNFAEGFIAEEVSELWEDWMRHVDEVLSDQALLTTLPPYVASAGEGTPRASDATA